jgi:uncharacterized membrane protein YjjP (DUF1212 family)
MEGKMPLGICRTDYNPTIMASQSAAPETQRNPPDDPPSPTEQDAIGFILRLGRALHTYGYAAHRLEQVLDQASRQLGLVGQFFSAPTSIFASFGDQDNPRTYLMRVEPGDVDLGRLALLDAVTVKVLHNQVSPAAGSREVETILAAPQRYGRLITTLAFGLASGSASRFLGGGVQEIAVSSILGLAIGILALVVGHAPSLGRVFEPVAAFAASLLAASAGQWIGAYSVYNATLAGLIVLIPGFTLTVAMTELSTRHLVSGTARLTGAFVLFLTIAFGVALGSRISSELFGSPLIAEAIQLPGWTEIVALITAPLAFTVILRAEPRDAIWIVIAGMFGVLGGRVGARTLGNELGVFVGALAVGVSSNIYGRLLNRPATVTLVPGILLLVPGSIGFRSLASLLDREVVLGVETAFRMILIAVALVAGMLVANIVAPPRKSL